MGEEQEMEEIRPQVVSLATRAEAACDEALEIVRRLRALWAELGRLTAELYSPPGASQRATRARPAG
jgi:hypothetical protein